MTATQTIQTLNTIDQANAAMFADKISEQATANAAKRQGVKAKAPRGKADKDAGSAAFANIGKQVKSTMVSVGGTNAGPEKVDAASFAAVTMAELSTSGSVLQNLAFNFLSGNIDKSITTDSLKDLPRALRN